MKLVTTSVRVGIACCRSAPGAGPDELYPDIDGPLLQTALEDAGCEAVLVAWDDPRTDWSQFSCVLIRSTWDSVDRPAEYLAWVQLVASMTVLVNPLAVIATTLDKRYLTALSRRGVAIPNTDFLEAEGELRWMAPSEEFVIKPAISGGGRETALYRAGDQAGACAHVRRLHGRGLAVIVQEHVPQVRLRGEIKLIFINGSFTHAIRTEALLNADVGVLERPWEVPTNPTMVRPTAAELAFAAHALHQVEELCGARTSYARVDVVSRSPDDVVLMEVELIDPSLSLWANSDAATQLAATVVALLA